jgi:hypothetical protein
MKLKKRATRAVIMGFFTGMMGLTAFVGVSESGFGQAQAEAGFWFKDKDKAKLVRTCYPCDSGVETCNC